MKNSIKIVLTALILVASGAAFAADTWSGGGGVRVACTKNCK
jgi:hypothetical protein